MSTITIQFEGLCCHVQTASGRRTLVLDARAHKHESYIELYAGDFDPADNLDWSFTPAYGRDGIMYQRAPVLNERIEIVNTITSSSFIVNGSFDDRIPKLSLIEPTFASIHGDYLATPIATNKVAAYFEFSRGTLTGGNPEMFKTKFVPPAGWSSRRLGQWAALEIQIDTSAVAPTFRAINLANGATRDLVLKSGATLITIGDQLLEDILGIPPNGRTGHFDGYYDLAGSILANRPQPQPDGLGLGVGCSNSSFP